MLNGLAAVKLNAIIGIIFIAFRENDSTVGMEQLNLPSIWRTKSSFYEIQFELLFLADGVVFFLGSKNTQTTE